MRTDRESLSAELIRFVEARVQIKLRGCREHDIEDVISETLLALTRAPRHASSDLWALARTITDRRSVDFVRRTRRRREILFADYREALPDTPDTVWVHIRQAELRRLGHQARLALLEATEAGSADRRLVELFTEGLYASEARLSLRQLGMLLWPARPQTACERFSRVLRRARALLREQGVVL